MATSDSYYNEFADYEKCGTPTEKDKVKIWKTAIGLQDVDGLKVTDYLKETAAANIEGNISINEAVSRVSEYYKIKSIHDAPDSSEEADKVSANIAKLLSENAFTFSPQGFLNVHKALFSGVMPHAGEIRPYNISKKEWVLRGDSVIYGRAEDIMDNLSYDIGQEKEFSYSGLDYHGLNSHLSRFVSNLWQNHPFREGNTRTTATFLVMYLRSNGFSADNTPFAENSWYFRNALVRANYNNAVLGVRADYSFLQLFFENLLFNKGNVLSNRTMLIGITDSIKLTTEPLGYLSLKPPVEVTRVIKAVGINEMSASELMSRLGLLNREELLNQFITPSVNEGFLIYRYPTGIGAPRQKYLLTVKGLTVFNELSLHKGI